jgi:predicted nucleic acid-binding protein
VADRVLDTNIVSYLFNGHTLATRYAPHLSGHTLLTCFMTSAEMYEGAFRSGWGPRRLTRLEAFLGQFVVIPADPDVCRRWGEVRAVRRAQPVGVADAWIAAAALVHGVELVTHNPAVFHGIPGLAVISEPP